MAPKGFVIRRNFLLKLLHFYLPFHIDRSCEPLHAQCLPRGRVFLHPGVLLHGRRNTIIYSSRRICWYKMAPNSKQSFNTLISRIVDGVSFESLPVEELEVSVPRVYASIYFYCCCVFFHSGICQVATDQWTPRRR